MEITAIIEALLVASDDPLPAAEIARLIRARAAEREEELLEEQEEGAEPVPTTEADAALRALGATSEMEVIEGLAQLNAHYEESGRAFRALERAKGWKIYTSPDYGEFVKHLFPGRKPKRLSGPAMETLAVVAYRQPVTKAAIDAVRGVSSDGMLQKLLDLELVKIGGRAELPGRPLLYETTDYFFEHFGVKSPDDLPNALELRGMDLPDGSESEEETTGDKEEGKQLNLAESSSADEPSPPSGADETPSPAENSSPTEPPGD
ncbi:SMC-Scp complex subunit ScpB [Roseibacillus ishigakijimensis]|uniref:SMC-Scp complex subunit ScpB n=1 Tax=Roseibacillus ishigakijimensis TaxID=454146 RepID=A0A934RLZ3_9BACT|nr:SMC-Scp complex subunit ScpB [Roseibacillus ishigakijimensis]MBK1834217.1 SMC-Scp complex subunit ScpB [Roseibacillus ishigakijimensis]